VNMMLTLRSIQFCLANNKQVIMRCCSYRRLVQFWQNFQTSLVLLIPNCTRHRMITYTNYNFAFTGFWKRKRWDAKKWNFWLEIQISSTVYCYSIWAWLSPTLPYRKYYIYILNGIFRIEISSENHIHFYI
jgi:hypothetical protein